MAVGQYWLSAKPARWKRDRKRQRGRCQYVLWGFLLAFLFACPTPLHYWNWHLLKVNIIRDFPPFRGRFLLPSGYVQKKKGLKAAPATVHHPLQKTWSLNRDLQLVQNIWGWVNKSAGTFLVTQHFISETSYLDHLCSWEQPFVFR